MYIKWTDSTVSKGGMNRELRVESKSERVRVSESKHEMRFQSFFYNNNECPFTPPVAVAASCLSPTPTPDLLLVLHTVLPYSNSESLQQQQQQ